MTPFLFSTYLCAREINRLAALDLIPKRTDQNARINLLVFTQELLELLQVLLDLGCLLELGGGIVQVNTGQLGRCR